MLQSMTGYGRAQVDGRHFRVLVEARSVNSRYLDIQLRLPPGGWALEPAIRRRVQGHIRRGRVEIHVHLEPLRLDEEPDVAIQIGRARAYQRALERLRADLGISGDVDLPLMASFRDLLSIREEDLEQDRPAIEQGIDSALAALTAMRRREGESLQRDLEDRIRWMERECAGLESLVPDLNRELIQRWRERLGVLAGDATLEPGRIEQEIAIWVDRLDVTEELVRLKSHLGQFRSTMGQSRGVGRKLEFLLQEMHREVNTLGSKTMSAELSHHVVEMKAQVERMREIVQNVE